MTIGDLTYSLGAEWDKGSLDKIKSVYEGVLTSVIASVGVNSAIMGGAFAITKEFAGVNDELGKLARNRNIAVDTLQAMEYSFESAGLAGSEAGNVIAKLQEQREGFSRGKADYEALGRLGLDPTAYKDNESFFNATIDAIKNVKSETEKADLAQRLLGSGDMMNLIDGGSEAIRKQKQELEDMGVLISNQDYQSSADFNDTLLKTTTILKGLANKVMTSIMPLFTKLMTQFNAFLKANKELISSGLKEFINAVINGSKFFLSLIGRVIEHLGGLKVVITVIVGLFVLWQLPLFAVIGILVLLMIAFDDVMTFFKGGESVIGSWINAIKESFAEFKSTFPNLGAIFQSQINNVIAIFNFFKDSIINIWGLITGELDFVTFFKNQLDIVANLLDTFLNGFLNTFEAIKNAIPSLESVGNSIGDSLSSFVPEWLGGASAPQVQAQAVSSQTTNHYTISATVDATNKTVSEAIEEIAHPEGY